MLELGRETKAKVFFLVLVYVFNIDLFEFFATILEKGLLSFMALSKPNLEFSVPPSAKIFISSSNFVLIIYKTLHYARVSKTATRTSFCPLTVLRTCIGKAEFKGISLSF